MKSHFSGPMLLSLLVTLLSFAAKADEACKYGQVDGTATAHYVRISLDANEFYSPVREIQFCERADKSVYLLVTEEQIRNFQVKNPPIAVTSGIEKSTGLTYHVLDDSSFAQKGLVLLVSKDGGLIKVYKNGNDLVDVLSRTP